MTVRTDTPRGSMRVGVYNGDLSEDRLCFLKQIGADDIFVTHSTDDTEEGLRIATDHVPTVERLVQIRTRLEEYDLRCAGIHGLAGPEYDKIMFGEEGAKKQIESIKRLLRNMGKAGIPILGYQWNPRTRNVIMSTSTAKEIRGGARTREFDLNEIKNPETSGDPDTPEYNEEAFWERYESFLEEVLPVAEEAEVRMALHPSDPPVIAKLEGIPRLFRDTASFDRAMSAVPSEYHGLKLCLGCFSEMGEDVGDIIHHFGERGDIVFIHFRDVVGSMPQFYETFVDEGNFNEYEVMKTLHEVGFSGVMIPDHVPSMASDDPYAAGRGFTVGYLRGLLNAVTEEYGE